MTKNRHVPPSLSVIKITRDAKGRIKKYEKIENEDADEAIKKHYAKAETRRKA